MQMKKLFLLFFLLLIIAQLSAQNKLLVKKNGGKKYYLFEQGNVIRFQTEIFDISGKIMFITDSSLVVRNKEVPIKDIHSFILKRKGYIKLQNYSITIGVSYASISFINSMLANSRPVFDKQTIIIGGGLTLAGILFRSLVNKKLKQGKKWHYEILNYQDLDFRQ